MKTLIIKETKNKGKGVFTIKRIKKGTIIYHLDLSGLKSYSIEEIADNPRLQSNHCDYVGRKRYVIDYSRPSYMNHSCDPNCLFKHKTITTKDIIALRDIKVGEELTHDYSATALDQWGSESTWEMKCSCQSENCRGIISGDFFKLPSKLQNFYYKYLPPSYKRRFRKNK